jgi:hypothetical protein
VKLILSIYSIYDESKKIIEKHNKIFLGGLQPNPPQLESLRNPTYKSPY